MAKRKPARRARQPLPALPSINPLPKTSRSGSGAVTLWGEVLEESETHLGMAIKNHGDALDVGLNGIHWIAKRQLFGNRGHLEGHDFVRVSFQYASLLAQSSQQCE